MKSTSEKRAPQWVSVEDRLPGRERVLIYFPKQSTSVMDALFSEGRFMCDGFDRTDAVTHWMPLPAPPNEAGPGASQATSEQDKEQMTQPSYELTAALKALLPESDAVGELPPLPDDEADKLVRVYWDAFKASRTGYADRDAVRAVARAALSQAPRPESPAVLALRGLLAAIDEGRLVVESDEAGGYVSSLVESAHAALQSLPANGTES